MNTSKTTALIITGLITIAIVLFIIQLLLRKLRRRSELNNKLKLSYGIWFSALFIAAVLVTAKSIVVLVESIDNVYKINFINPVAEIAKATSLFTGLSAVWFLIWYFIANLLSVLITGNRNEVNEMEADNYVYFLIKGILFIGYILCLLPIFETLLRAFMPSVELPFYH
jgi:hypothetical protein